MINNIINLIDWAAEEYAIGNEEKGKKLFNKAAKYYDKDKNKLYNDFNLKNLIELKKLFNKYENRKNQRK